MHFQVVGDSWLVCTPVNASPVPSRAPAGDYSGAVWLASLLLYGSYIHYSLPFFAGARWATREIVLHHFLNL